LKEWTFEAKIDRIPWLTEQVDALLEGLDCPIKAQMQIDVAIDELLANIASYAYETGEGQVTVRFDFQPDDRTVALTFIDKGIPYDPLAKPDPDVALEVEKRSVGGLGIFLVKKTMDDMTYARRDGHNMLTIRKRI
jgi:anti-sigma regulatory factor (Ser/Thr protein kinase)